MDEARIPVIVGVGQINDRPEGDAPGLNSLELMEAALRRADEDAGGGWLKQLESLAAVAQLSFFELGDVSKPLAEALGASPRHCAQTKYPMGDSPVLLLSEAANRIAAGEAGVAAVVGGEALRTAARRAKQKSLDAVRASASTVAKPLRQRYGIVAPTDLYPLYENACRATWGQTLAEGQAESAAIWSAFSRVAAESEGAWLKKPLKPADILAESADNRPIAFPYTKLMVANSSVNQGAGFIVTSLAKAKAMGAPEARLVYVGRGAAAREPGDILARDRYDHSPSMRASLKAALAFNGLQSSDLDHVELYSCFPCIPKLARRILDWPLDRPMSVFGGLTFGGGPIGNYMSHAVAAMTDTLRRSGRHGLLFGNGGYATTNHVVVVSRDPAMALREPASFDVQAEADAARGPAPVFNETYGGRGAIETYTVFYDRGGAPTFGTIVARAPSGERFLSRVPGDDAESIARLTCGDREPVGAAGEATPDGEGLMRWRFAA
jgi:acetyl-CoA C-acetyltransferase